MRRVILAMIVAAAVLGAALIVNLSRQPGPQLTVDSLPEGVSRHRIQGVSVFLARHGREVGGFLDSTQHLPGEPLWWCPEEEVFVGPSHAELFNVDGQLIEGPAIRDLDRIRVTVTAGGAIAVDPHIVQRGTVRAQRRLGSSGVPPEVWTAYRGWLDGNLPFCEGHLGAGQGPGGGSIAPVLVSAEDTPDPVLGGEPVTFVLHWRQGGGALRAVICKTNSIAEGVCSDGAWATGHFSSSSPAVAQYVTSERAPDVYLYYPFVCDSSGLCSEPIKASLDTCPHFNVVAEADDDPGPYACDQSPAVADETDYPPPASPVPISGMTGRPTTSGFKTEVWSVEETLIEDGLRVIVSTAPGTFALTGGVIDEDTGEAVVGALVTIETSRGDTAKALTDDHGTFALIDVPIASRGERVVFSVRAAGYEFHRVVDEFDADTYAITAELDPARSRSRR